MPHSLPAALEQPDRCVWRGAGSAPADFAYRVAAAVPLPRRLMVHMNVRQPEGL